jgi:UDP-glucose 6-dehydrogenase
MMLQNEQIHPSFTNVPGHDGQISYGGLCFPKDTNALNQYMIRNNIPNELLEGCIKERNKMRKDHDNCNLY